MNRKIKKIHVCGTHGAGKTTLAKEISKKQKIPYYSLTDIKYIKRYSKQRTEKEMRAMIKEIARKKSWITEECWSDRAEEFFKKADLVILLIPKKIICQYRVLKRFFLRKKQEKDNLNSAIKICINVGRYYQHKKPSSLNAQIKLIKKYSKKVLIIKDKKELISLLK